MSLENFGVETLFEIFFLIFDRYRLVRHVWQLNVNESLCMGASCSIGNLATGELGVDVNIKNLNQVHHPLMTEIMLNDISLFSPTYQINSKKVICTCVLMLLL